MIPILSVILLLGLFLWMQIYHDTHHFVIRTYHLPSSKLQEELTIVLVSDLHGQDYGAGNQALLSAIRTIHPDLILSAGDIITSYHHLSRQTYDTGSAFLSALAGEFPVYAANGNHEHRLLMRTDFAEGCERYLDELKGAGVCILNNASSYFPLHGNKKVYLYGLDLDDSFFKRFSKRELPIQYLHETLGEPVNDAFRILIAHNPAYFPVYAAWGADLVVSGHVHGGIVKLPFFGGVISPSFRLFPKYDGGKYHINSASCGDSGSTMILGRGLGTHTLPVRLFNPGELVVIHLHPAVADRK